MTFSLQAAAKTWSESLKTRRQRIRCVRVSPHVAVLRWNDELSRKSGRKTSDEITITSQGEIDNLGRELGFLLTSGCWSSRGHV